jgi:hypothetical protein
MSALIAPALGLSELLPIAVLLPRNRTLRSDAQAA